VRSLTLFSPVTQRVLQQVAKLTGLTEMDMCISRDSTGTLNDLGLTLQPLQQLRELRIYHCRNLQLPLLPPVYKRGVGSECLRGGCGGHAAADQSAY
jgi:hypothetical protein